MTDAEAYKLLTNLAYVAFPCAVGLYALFVFAVIVGPRFEKKESEKRRAEVAASELAPCMSIPVATHIVEADLRSLYGNNTIAAVACDFENVSESKAFQAVKAWLSPDSTPDNRGDTEELDPAITAWVVLDNALPADQRTAMLVWAEAQIRTFRTSTNSADLVLGGWHHERSSRWQILAHDGPVWGADLDFAATVTLRGPVKAAHARQIVERLREHRATLTANREDQKNRIDLRFTFSAGSWHEGQLRAKSLSADLGYPVVRIDVLPA